MTSDVDILRVPVVTGRSPSSTTVRAMRQAIVTGREVNSTTVRAFRLVAVINESGVAAAAAANPTVVTEIF